MKVFFLKIYSFFQKISGFKKFGNGSIIKLPSKIWNRKFIEIGRNVFIAENSFLSISSTGETKPIFKIGNGVCIGSNFFAACIDKIIIEDNVLFSDRVFISDHIHNYENISKPVMAQELKKKGKVLIKSGSFIGINSVIMPGVTIGKNSVVGASSVVTKDIPDYSIAIGNPAKVIRYYNKSQKCWIKT